MDNLWITASRVAVCSAHLQPYLDEPSWLATTEDYHAWLRSHGNVMRCERCMGATGGVDDTRDAVVAGLSD